MANVVRSSVTPKKRFDFAGVVLDHNRSTYSWADGFLSTESSMNSRSFRIKEGLRTWIQCSDNQNVARRLRTLAEIEQRREREENWKLQSYTLYWANLKPLPVSVSLIVIVFDRSYFFSESKQALPTMHNRPDSRSSRVEIGIRQ